MVKTSCNRSKRSSFAVIFLYRANGENKTHIDYFAVSTVEADRRFLDSFNVKLADSESWSRFSVEVILLDGVEVVSALI